MNIKRLFVYLQICDLAFAPWALGKLVVVAVAVVWEVRVRIDQSFSFRFTEKN